MLERLGSVVLEVRTRNELDKVDGLIIPGGESTTIVQLLDIFDMRDHLVNLVKNGMPIWGTCAGMIVLANSLTDHRPNPLKLMDINVTRNAFGRQVDSFEADLEIDEVDGQSYKAIFIRAPIVNSVGPNVRVISRLNDGRPVAVRENHMLATAFHPELTLDHRIHQMFLGMVEETRR
ncbi:MAG: pyridoxal 5'-phosphate synthase glutaminase subunit PdxT [SAR202 cluster bacterium]|nr:pyridoxal 5'-phosphate synthase glutaminase subunit PdxT [SAR202 cluster bacterium]